jgi:thiol-disulfide isomerase/thioredoxin
MPNHPCGRSPASRPRGTVKEDRVPDTGRRSVLALLGLGCIFLHRPVAATPEEVPIGGLLRDAPLRGLNGPSRRLAQFRGRPLLINIWASWCGPCIEEMASIERLAWMEGRLPFALIGISTDDSPEPAQAYLHRSNATISHFIDHALEIENMLGAARIPLTVLVGSDGRVLDKIYGAREWDAPESLRLIARAFGREKTLTQR